MNSAGLGTIVAAACCAALQTPSQAANVPAAPGERAHHAAAPSVFRCEPPPGSASKAVYSDQPCPQGSAVDARDQRTAQQRRDATAQARQEARWAESIRRERQQQERTAAAQAQRAAPVIDQPRVNLSPDRRREADLKRLSQAPRRASPLPANAGTAPKATPDRP